VPPKPTLPAPTPQPTVKITTAPRPCRAPAPAPKPAAYAAGPAQPAFIVDDKGNKVIQMKPPVVVRDLAQRIGVKSHVLLPR
jgi:translation initiation factor IF-2